MEPGVEISQGCSQAPGGKCLVDPAVDRDGAFWTKAGISVDEVAKVGVEAGSESLEQGGRPVSSAGVRSNLRAALVQEPGDGAVSRVCGRRGRNYGAPIRRRCRRVESRALERKTLSAERGGDFQPVVQEALLDLYKARIAALSHIGGRCGGGIQ